MASASVPFFPLAGHWRLASAALASHKRLTYRRQRFAGGGPWTYTKHRPREIFNLTKKINP